MLASPNLWRNLNSLPRLARWGPFRSKMPTVDRFWNGSERFVPQQNIFRVFHLIVESPISIIFQNPTLPDALGFQECDIMSTEHIFVHQQPGRARHTSKSTWEEFKKEICELFEKWPIEQVVATMESSHYFYKTCVSPRVSKCVPF